MTPSDDTAMAGAPPFGFGAPAPFSPLAQGMLTNKYLGGVPSDSRAAQGKSLSPELLTELNLAHIRALNGLAGDR